MGDGVLMVIARHVTKLAGPGSTRARPEGRLEHELALGPPYGRSGNLAAWTLALEVRAVEVFTLSLSFLLFPYPFSSSSSFDSISILFNFDARLFHLVTVRISHCDR